MKSWWIEPRDSLMIGDGRPKGLGVGIRSLSFPWPSTLAGFIRTRVGSDREGRFVLTREEALGLLEVSVKGPLLAEDRGGSEAPRVWVPTPRDAIWHAPEGASEEERRLGRGLQCRRLVPRALPDGVQVDDEQDGLEVLDVVDPSDFPKGKAAQGPAFLSWSAFEEWLVSPPGRTRVYEERPGLDPLPGERRVHVSIDPETGTAAEGRLFETEMLRFALPTDRARYRGEIRRFGLLVGCDDARLKPGVGHLGGERRISRVDEAGSWPGFPEGFEPTGRRVRLVLLTPGIFAKGYRPRELDGATLVAAAVDRPAIISGWDMAARGPKATRRMATAGTVYWYELDEGVDVAEWARRHWMTSLCDDAQDARDGFGLCAVGVA